MIADAVTGRARIEPLHEHQTARLVQAKLLLILHRRHRRDRLEVMMEGRHAHADAVGKVFDAQWPREILLQPCDGARDPVAVAVCSGDVDQPRAIRPGQHPVEDFLFDQRRHGRNVAWTIEQAQQADGSIQELRRSDVHRHPALPVSIGGRARNIDAAEQLQQLFGIDCQSQAEMRNLRARLRDAPGDRQVERGQQIVPSPVADKFRAEAQALGSLQYKGKTRPVAAVQRIAGLGATADVKIADISRELAVTSREAHRDIDNFLIGAEGQSHAATLSVNCLTPAIPFLSRVPWPFRKQAGVSLLQDRAKS
ncbi:hypothetical protein CUJ84_Chr003064 [Rhizobium leguminosarum]|uniref:Uncharacterized protein n=1 Tax=Rhizobium leguminosarum TaxID=384 RepID=A0A2K9Z597_RHILE|nr:hypothetical protein CUJ84_Chr003064 [Rhizobium leguminosarum]